MMEKARTVARSLAESAFARHTAGYFGKLAALHVLYAAWFFFSFSSSVPYAERVIRTGAGTAFIMALLMGTAVFLAAADHFDLFGEKAPETRRRDWGCLALCGVATCLMMEVGLPLADWLLAAVEAPVADLELPPWGVAMRLLVPVAIGTFVVVAGVAGGALGQMTWWASPGRRLSMRWSAALGFTALFTASLVLWGEAVVAYGIPYALIPVVPPLLPLVAACWLVRKQGYGVLEVLGLGPKPPLSPEALDRLLDALREEGKEGAPSIEEVARTPEELKMARFLKWFRQVAAPVVKVSEAEAKQMVAIALKTAPAAKRASRWASWRSALANVGDFGLSWAALSAGLATTGVLIGMMPSLVPALTVGGLGATVSAVSRHRVAASPAAA